MYDAAILWWKRPKDAFTVLYIYLRHCYLVNPANSGPHAQESNVCVLGAGVMGLSVALRLRQVRHSWLFLLRHAGCPNAASSMT